MNLTLVEEDGASFVEGAPSDPFMAAAQDVDRLIEYCFAEGAQAALLYAANLPPAFFDLSSGAAGIVLQKLRIYRIRLAVVCPPGGAALSSRFTEMVADERRGSHFGLFEDRAAAVDWLRRSDQNA